MNGLESAIPQIRIGNMRLHPMRLLVFLGILILMVLPGAWGEATRQALMDGYTSVAVFVYATLLIFYALETRYNRDFIGDIAKYPRWQVFLAALFGSLPGCGGAILVVTGYAAGRLSFGALVATLTATMGDAAFLLIAEAPLAALVVLPLSLVAGTLTGILVDQFYKASPHIKQSFTSEQVALRVGKLRARDLLIFLFFIPGIVIGVMGLMNVDGPAWADQFSLAGMLLTLTIWAFSPIGRVTNPHDHPLTRANEETAFVMIYVVLAFWIFEVSQAVFGLDVKALFGGVAVWMPLIATLVGFIPGCGPQIITTTLYISGAIPFGALLANAISNDGDALFPAFAIAPRDALAATLITAIPALLLGYGFFFFAPLFLAT